MAAAKRVGRKYAWPLCRVACCWRVELLLLPLQGRLLPHGELHPLPELLESSKQARASHVDNAGHVAPGRGQLALQQVVAQVPGAAAAAAAAASGRSAAASAQLPSSSRAGAPGRHAGRTFAWGGSGRERRGPGRVTCLLHHAALEQAAGGRRRPRHQHQHQHHDQHSSTATHSSLRLGSSASCTGSGPVTLENAMFLRPRGSGDESSNELPQPTGQPASQRWPHRWPPDSMGGGWLTQQSRWRCRCCR
jgi:hypothetical protein